MLLIERLIIKKDPIIKIIEPLNKQISMLQIELNGVKEQLAIPRVSGSFVITESAQEKLDFILGHSTTRDFPKTQPTKEWAGAVLDFLEITKLLK